MANKKTNEILEEQRKAREDFLALKKMQHGEMEAPPKPSEVAILPKTPKEKMANFWFQYKWHVIAIAALTIFMTVMIVQCASRVKYDLEVVYFTYHAVLDEQTGGIAAYIEQFANDLNGDGEVHVQVVNCSYEKGQNDTQYAYTMMTKLQAMLAADENALLFITDEESYAYLAGLSDTEIFEGEPYPLGEGFYTATRSETFGDLPEGLRISCRRLEDTVVAKKKTAQSAYEDSLHILEELKKAG